MNGICGFIAQKNYEIDEHIIESMFSAIYGNANIQYKTIGDSFADYSVQFSSDADSPNIISNDRFILIMNGCIYNRKDLKNQLIAAGEQVEDVTDGRLVLASFSHWGENCLKYMNGKFVWAIFDKTQKRLFIGRDHFGKQPLYYFEADNAIAFSTDLKSLLHFPLIQKSIDKQVLAYFLRLGYIPAPYSIIENVKKLPAGSVLIHAGNKTEVRKYWSPNEAYHQLEPFKGSYNDALNQLEEILLDAVRLRLQNIKSIGALLSSGIDSSLIAAMVQKESGRNLESFTVGMDDKRYNEAELAKAIAQKLGTRHHEYTISEQDLLHCVDELPALMDEPFGDSGLIPMMVVSKLSGKDVDVVFTGDGGDEVFEGYLHYGFVRQAQKYEPIGKVLHTVLPASLRAKLPHSIKHVVENRNPETQTQLLIPEEISRMNRILTSPFMAPYFNWEVSMDISNWEARRQVLDMETSFVDDAIEKSGLAAKSVGLDLRSPLIDYRVAELSLSLPSEFKSKGTVTKRILRDLAYKYVSKELLDLPKRGFCIPIDSWMNSVLQERIADYSSDSYLIEQGLFNPDALRDAIAQNYSLKWNFFVLQQWYQENIK